DMEGAGAFRRRVVLKMLAPERLGDERLATMLADEARVVGLLHHPGIVAALDYLETEEHGPVFVLEFVDGASLRTVLKLGRRQNAVMPEVLAAHIGAQVAHALHAAHTALGRDGRPLEVVHRDVAPDNVLLSRAGAVYLGDFGVARAAGSAEIERRDAGPKGKRGYMAPEQARGGKVGPPADVFSLGRLIAEAADVDCGPQLRAVIERATADDPRDRFASASEMAAALLHACPPPNDPDRALAEWIRTYAASAFLPGSSPPPLTRSEPPPAGRPSASDPRRLERAEPLFAAMPPPRRRVLKAVAACAALLFLSLPVALLFAAPHRAQKFLQSAITGAPRPSHGAIRITARPGEAEVYVDGALRGMTPALVEVPSGNHSVRVGSRSEEHTSELQSPCNLVCRLL